jgi:DNA-binding HxlR family transcriptional regulator
MQVFSLFLFMKKITRRSNCPVSFSLDFLGDKWSLLLIRDMVLYNKSAYGEFLTSPEKISTNILADRLAVLEQYGFITRRVSTEKKNKIIYGMTEKSIDLVPIIMEYTIWGAKYNPAKDDGLMSELNKDKEKTIIKYQDKIRKSLNTAQ